MNKKGFSKFKDVFAFTYKQQRQSKGFVVTTYVVPAIIFALFFAIAFLMAFFSDSKIDYVAEKIYVIDNTGIGHVEEVLAGVIGENENLSKIEIVGSDKTDAKDVCKEMSEDEKHSLVLTFGKDEEKNTFTIVAMLPKWSDISGDESDEILAAASMAMTNLKVITSGIDPQTVIYMESYVQVMVHETGDPDYDLNMLVKMLVPLIIILILYMMLMIYGQSTGKIVALEKNSKLMEYMLTAVHPDSLVSGKIIAISIQSILQMSLWIIGGVAGFKVGEMAGKAVAPDYENVLSSFLDMFASGTSAFSAASIAIAAVAVIAAVIFFSFLAGLFGSLVTKPEELANTMGLYNLIVMVGYLAAFIPTMGSDGIVKDIVSIIPITAAFALPGNVAVGNVSILVGVIGLLLLVISCVIMAVLCGKVYKSRVFNNGKASKLAGFIGKLGKM